MLKRTIVFFDKLEDRIRTKLSHYPIVYAFVGGVGIVLFWKGVWEMAEVYPALFGPTSMLLGLLLLLMTGLLVSFFIGDNIIISGLTREKKIVEKTENEVRSDSEAIDNAMVRLRNIEDKLEVLVQQTTPKARSKKQPAMHPPL